MKQYFAVLGWFVPIVLLALLTSCGGGGGTAGSTGARRFGSLEYTLTTPKTTYARGEPVPLTFTIRNIGSKTVNTAGGGCFTFRKITQGSQIVPEEGIGCNQDGWSRSFAPGETQVINEIWDQKDMNGNLDSPGQYTITYWSTAGTIDNADLTPAQSEEELAANPVQVTIVP